MMIHGKRTAAMLSGLVKHKQFCKARKQSWPQGVIDNEKCGADEERAEIIFLGTSAALATASRNTSCVALKLGNVLSVFDCGEGAYRQLQKTYLRTCGVENIFISHMHADHVSGLPGFLCALGELTIFSKKPVEIFGPQGLREWLRLTLRTCSGKVASKYVVNELILKEERTLTRAASRSSAQFLHEDELPGEDIACSGDGVWHVLENDCYSVTAGLLRHNVPCWGYVLEEILPKRLENLSLNANRRRRKFVILGDTGDSRSLLIAAKNADVLVHEATTIDSRAPESMYQNHSSPDMAVNFAKAINAHCLVLTHFSGYLDKEVLKTVVSSATAQLKDGRVLLAQDFLRLTIL